MTNPSKAIKLSKEEVNAGGAGGLLKLTSLWNAHRPCILVELKGLKVLLDCAIGMDSFASFLPCSLVRGNRISWQKKVHPYGKAAIPVLKQINDLVYVELMPEIRTIESQNFTASLDAILISNIASLIALPVLLRGGNFHGAIYATDPIIQLGKLIMENLCDMFERVDRPSADEWSWKSIAKTFPNPPASDPKLWTNFYSREEMEECLARINRVFFREEIVLNDQFKVTPYSSGHSIGACNWLLQHGSQRIGYLTASSLRHSHPKTMELTAFTKLDSLILTSMSSTDQGPDMTVYKFTTAVVETLKIGGNVLVPVVPTGLVYDLFECVLKAIEVNNLSRSIPVYFISSVAEVSLEFANIFSEWLSDDKGSRVYKPEEPFFHSELVRSGRIRVFNNLNGQFSREYRQPCIVFTGHPSLRIGEVVHLLDFWGGNSRNAIMMVDPDYPLETYYAPYKSLAIRAYYFPIETRLDCTQVLNKIITDLSPKHVLYPEEYAPILSTLSALAFPTTTYRQNQPIHLDPAAQWGMMAAAATMKKRKIGDGAEPLKKRIKLDAEILQQLKLNASMQGLSPIHGLLSVQKHCLKLQAIEKPAEKKGKKQQKLKVPKSEATVKRIRQERYGGKLDVKLLMETMAKRKLDVELGQISGGMLILIKSYSASLRILQGGRRTLISCNNEDQRKIVQTIVHECLAKFSTSEATTTSNELRPSSGD